MSKHTPGPWAVASDPFPAVFVTGSDGLSVAELWLRGNRERELANARLIAAAPELLEALEFYLIQDEISEGYGGGVGSAARKKARAAIAKATGEQA